MAARKTALSILAACGTALMLSACGQGGLSVDPFEKVPEQGGGQQAFGSPSGSPAGARLPSPEDRTAPMRFAGSCPSDLSGFVGYLQSPDNAAISPSMAVSAYVEKNGGRDGAVEAARQDLAAAQLELDDVQAKRDAFGGNDRIQSDARIAQLEDRILLNRALIGAIRCN